MVKSYNGEVFVIPKEFEEEIRADEREKCKCPYWNEEHRECATSFEEDIRADERKKVLDNFKKLIEKRQTTKESYSSPPCFDMGVDMVDILEIIAQLKEQKK